MKTYIQDIREITDSREMLEARPNSFIIWFIYILLGIIAAALAWAYFGEIEDYVKANGSVRPVEAVSSIRNLVAGRVDKNNLEEGKSVRKGDVLYTIETEGAQVEKNEYESQVKRLELENRNLLKLKQSINEEKNLFDRNNKDEIDYYNRYRKYETDRLVNIEQYANQGLDIEQLRRDAKLSLNTARINLERANKTLEQQKLLEKSIKEGKNLFDEKEVEYYNRYIDYKMSIDKLDIAKQQSSDNYEKIKKLYNAGGAALKELEDAKNRMDLAILDLEGFKNEYMMNLKSSMIESQQAIDEITVSTKKAQSIIETFGDKEYDRDVILEKMRLDT
ncbi:MAG: biotin/lipoyl-binding protein, partial [Clostridiaceae bacterium]|nr:biotin/lipoyl-binding protein [Clostridiaceae bacterium]